MSLSGVQPARSVSEISEQELSVRFSIDLVAAGRRNIKFLKLVSESQWLHQKPTLIEAIRRYDEVWMPLISDLTVDLSPPAILPPIDVEWVWFCHCLNPVSYRNYCESKFRKLVGKPAIFDEENEDYALNRCQEIWIKRYPTEPFENEININSKDQNVTNEHLLDLVLMYKSLYDTFSEPYMSEIVYLIAAKQRYKGLIYMIERFGDKCSVLIPTKDILLLWLTHQSYPAVYRSDMKEMEEKIEKVIRALEFVKVEEVEETKRLWDLTFGQPYEKAGCPTIGRVVKENPPVYWEIVDNDVNTKYKSLFPRFFLEVCIMGKQNLNAPSPQNHMKKEFIRLRFARSHKSIKLNKPIPDLASTTWQKAWNLYSEFGTKGIILESRAPGSGICSKGSNLRNAITFSWSDLLRAPSLTISKEIDQNVSLVCSITPPVQVPYLLKCVPDRVTDDTGTMISDVVLKMNQYRPQEGRWLSRTVLDHAGRECFVVRTRVCDGIWRRGGDIPSIVKWEERITEVREGSWSYIAGSIGRAPQKVVGTATPKVASEGWLSSWKFSNGDELDVRWGSSESSSLSLTFDLNCQEYTRSSVRLLQGRHMQYCINPQIEQSEQNKDDFITLVRYSDKNPTGKATALLNWKLQAAEISPEEDTVLILLLSLTILRSVCEARKEDVGNLLFRRRLKEPKLGEQDWGSVIISSNYYSSPFVQNWYLNANTVVVTGARLTVVNYSPEEGSDKLYKRGLIGV